MSSYSWKTAHDDQIRRAAGHVHEENARLRQQIEALKAANSGLRDRIEKLEPFAVANAKLLRARRDAEGWLADEEMLEHMRKSAWFNTKAELKDAWTADNQPIIPEGWPADTSPEEAVYEFVGLTRDAKRLASGDEGGVELPEAVPTDGTFLHALAAQRRIER